MGSGGKKETNKQLGEQRNLANQYAANQSNMGAEEYAWRTGLRGDIANEYWNLYKGQGTGAEGGGGGGGGGYSAPAYVAPGRNAFNVQMNEAMPTARELMNTGLWSPSQIAESKSFATAPIPGIYEGLKRQLASRQAGMGNPGTFGAGSALLAREAAYRGGEVANQATMDIEQDIRNRRTSGIGLVGGFDEERMAALERENARANEFAEREAARQNAAAQAAASASAAASRAASSQQDDYLRSLERLMGNDLPYWDRELAGIQTGITAATGRVDETPAWQKALTNIIPSAASAAIGSFSNPFDNKKSGGPAATPDYNDPFMTGIY